MHRYSASHGGGAALRDAVVFPKGFKGLGFRVLGLGFWVLGFGFWV